MVLFFSRDVTAAILLFQSNETAAILVYQTNVGVDLFSYVETSVCSNTFIWLLAT